MIGTEQERLMCLLPPAAMRNGSTGRQQLEATTTLPSAAKLATAVLAEPDLFLSWFSSTRDILISVRAIQSVESRQQRTTVLMLNFPF